MKQFNERVAVITGAGGGIGSAVAIELARKGCHLALVDINRPQLEKTRQQCEGYGIKVTIHQVNIANNRHMAELAASVLTEHGKVNILVNNAGITLQKSFSTHTIEDWERIIGVNLWGVIHGCHHFLPALRQADEAHIVNLSSVAAFAGLPSQSSYCATKAAVKALSESLWSELAVEGIGLTTVHPGAVRTDMIKATIADSDDQKAAQRNFEMAQKMGVSPEYAAKQIVAAIEKNRMRIRIGKDAVILDLLKRLLPKVIHKPMIKLAAKQAARNGNNLLAPKAGNSI